MLVYIVRRLLNLVPTFLGATLLVFFISQLVPGDYFTQLRLDPTIKPETIDRQIERFGLDKSWPEQYVIWMGNLLQGDLGVSFDSGQPVRVVLTRPILNSMVLVVLALFMLYLMSIPLGVWSARRQYSWGDQIVGALSYFGLAIPNFFFALLLILVLFQLRRFTGDVFGWNELLFPVAKMTSSTYNELGPVGKFFDVMWHALLPAFVVATAGIAGLTRVLRAQMLDVLGSDYIRTANAKGLATRTVTYKHALRNAIIPFVAGIGGLLPGLISGAGLVEIVFAWPGITPILLRSIGRLDLYVVLGFLVISSLLLMIGNLVSDLLLAAVDPRIRYG